VSEPAFDAENVKREILPRDEVLRRLKVLAGTKTGEPIPDFFSTPNGWGELLSALAARAAELIREMDETFDFRWQADMRAIERWQAEAYLVKIDADNSATTRKLMAMFAEADGT
jgi:hypothetical protein